MLGRYGHRFASPLLIGALATTLFAPSCAKQGEGERCDKQTSGNGDCESPLVCVESTDLANGEIGDRCCPPEGQSPNDDRCFRKVTGSGGSAGAAGSAGASGSAGAAGSAGSAGSAGAAGAAGSAGAGGTTADAGSCQYNSDCPGDLVCGPTGVCQPECVTNKDCTSPLVCAAGKCQASALDASSG
jgi:hypothetical protein